MKTIYSHFCDRANQQPKRKALAWKVSGGWASWDYGETLSRVDKLANGLIGTAVAAGDRLAILSENRPEWAICDLAINKIGAVSVPIHVTANDETVEYIIRDSECGHLFVSPAVLHSRRELLQRLGKAHGLRVVLFDLTANPDKTAHSGISLLSSLSPKGEPLPAREHELASIIYTSGTTGEPKGVMLSNRNLSSNTLSSIQKIHVGPEDVFLSFLPLSHVLERMAGNYIPLFAGASIAYAESAKELQKNLKEIKPTILISVPKIFERMLERIFSEMKLKPKPVQTLFYCSLKSKPHAWYQRAADRLFDSRIRGIFGGRLRFAICGGAAVNGRVLRFFKNMGVQIAEGYGMTETSPVIAVNTLEDNRLGTVGQPLSGTEVRIASDKEIMVKGENVMMGYWRKPELTKEVMTEDGWLRTGDLGFMDKEGFVTIIGRKKDIIVTSNGKNIFPEKIETELGLSPCISQCLVVGHKQSHLAALIVPDHELLCGDGGNADQVREAVGKEIERINKKFDHLEAIREFKVIDRPFTIEANELTPTLKVRRHVIEKHFSDEIERLFSR
jgi:long-chain acyl-CoA synthetase